MKETIALIVIFVVGIIISFYNSNKQQQKLKHSKTEKVIILSRDLHFGAGAGAIVKFKAKNITYKTFIKCDCRDIEPKDTILIRYSIEDPEVAYLVDKYYMKKYQHLKQ